MAINPKKVIKFIISVLSLLIQFLDADTEDNQ